VSIWFQARQSESLVGIMQIFSELADGMNVGIAIAVVLISLLVMRKWRAAIMFTLIVPGGALLGELIKLLVGRARPMYQGWFVDWGGYSFPSGHTMCATLIYGGLAVWLFVRVKSAWQRAAIAALAAVMIVLVGLSRVALGAHYVTDCAAAVVIGFAWIGICTVGFRRFANRRAAVPVSITR
jgi:undecaprenyl-diphosphatase